MTDRELLILAAKAAGMPEPWSYDKIAAFQHHATYWNPLEDDGDAMRLAVKPRIRFWVEGGGEAEHGQTWTVADVYGGRETFEDHGNHADDACAATRGCIVRVAAEIGKAMP